MIEKLTAPKHLRAATKKWWKGIVSDFELEPHHLSLLQLACESWDRGQTARAVLEKEGLTYLDRFDAPRQRPEVSIERDARTGFARLLRELRLDVSPPDDSRPSRMSGGRGRS